MFFCFGPPKSGTTLLQNCLNAHPDISCPSEHSLTDLYVSLDLVISKYNELLSTIGERTGGQHATTLDIDYVNDVYRFAVQRMGKCESKKHKAFGINDNRVLTQLDFYNQTFNYPKLIAIFRHPLHVATSWWFHNHRLAEAENDPAHLEEIKSFGDFNAWGMHVTDFVVTQMEKCKSFQLENPNLLIVSYEELVDKKAKALRQIFNFLDQNEEASLIDDIMRKTSFEKMKANSSQPGFFRAGRRSAINPNVSAETQLEVDQIYCSTLKKLGISCSNYSDYYQTD